MARIKNEVHEAMAVAVSVSDADRLVACALTFIAFNFHWTPVTHSFFAHSHSPAALLLLMLAIVYCV